jgi:hypothetical protein
MAVQKGCHRAYGDYGIFGSSPAVAFVADDYPSPHRRSHRYARASPVSSQRQSKAVWRSRRQSRDSQSAEPALAGARRPCCKDNKSAGCSSRDCIHSLSRQLFVSPCALFSRITLEVRLLNDSIQIIPIIERGLRERSSEIKRKASQIVGNMSTLTESKDLTPYLPQLVPRVREVLVDPVPEARATAARALGSLVERLGEDTFPDLIPALMTTLSSNASGVDQQGAAQGLAEILSGLGIDRLEGLLPTIISNTSSPRPYVREGFISLIVFLPATFGERFQPYLPRIIQPVLSGLADESEYVREASMRAGRMIVANHSTKAVDLLLPELERGLFEQAWRIRHSSIQLVGELLFRISGISGKVEVDENEEEDVLVPETPKKALVDVLGRERRDRVLASIYVVRQDATGIVRAYATHVWKALVQNTPRTVREVLPTLSECLGFILLSIVRHSIAHSFHSAHHCPYPFERGRRSARGK